MGSLTAMARRPMSAERARLLEAVQRSRYALKDLSVMLGRNHSYLQQYVARGSPRHLPEDVRLRLAELLGIDDGELRDGAGVRRAAPPPPPPPAKADGRRVPLMIENAAADPTAPSWPLSSLTDDAGDSAVAVALTEAHGILQPRAVLLCDRDTQPRVGDLSVMLAGSRVLAIGLLLPSKRGTVSLLTGDSAEPEAHVPTAEGVLWRVVALRAA